MGSATTQALATTTAELTAAKPGDLTVSRELFAAAREIADSTQLSGALSSWGAPAEARAQVAKAVFAGYSPAAVQLIRSNATIVYATAATMFTSSDSRFLAAFIRWIDSGSSAPITAMSRMPCAAVKYPP